MGSTPTDGTTGLAQAGRELVCQLDTRAILARLAQAARELTGARYAAVGILDERRAQLAEFVASGVDRETHEAIGAPPRGRGVLGALIEDPGPLRLRDVGKHPLSYGFPPGHPQMHSFLGVPIAIGAEIWGNLYLTDKAGGPFGEQDEQAVVALVEWASIALGNARAYRASERRRLELEQALRGLEASRDVTLAIGSEVELEHTLELIAKRGRALVDAQSVAIGLHEDGEMVVGAGAGYVDEERRVRVPLERSVAGSVLRKGVPERLEGPAARLRMAEREFGVAHARTALLVPMLYRDQRLGVLAAFDRGPQGQPFGEEEERLMHMFAVSAATAVALVRSVESERATATGAERLHT